MTRPGRRRRADSPYVEQAARLAASLRDRREQAELSQEQLAARARVAVATVRKIERGIVIEPGYFTVLALMQALGAGHEDTADLGPITGVILWSALGRRRPYFKRHRVRTWSSDAQRRSTAGPWNGSWNGGPRNSSAISASGVIRRVICAGHAVGAREQAPRNVSLIGSHRCCSSSTRLSSGLRVRARSRFFSRLSALAKTRILTCGPRPVTRRRP